MELKLGMWISLLLAGRSGSLDLILGCTIWNIYGKELLSVWCVCWGDLERGCFHSSLFSGLGWRTEVLLEQVQLNFIFRNKFIILLPCGVLEDNSTFSKMCNFKILTGCTNYGGYVVKRYSACIRIRVNDHTVASRSVFVHRQSFTFRFLPRPAKGTISFLVHDSKVVNYYNGAAEDSWFGWQKIERNDLI